MGKRKKTGQNCRKILEKESWEMNFMGGQPG